MKLRWTLLASGFFGAFLGIAAASVYGLSTDTEVQLSWVEPTFEAAATAAWVAVSVGNLILMYVVFRWFTRYIGMSRGPIVTRQIGGHDVRKSRRGTELPPLKFMLRRIGCKHATVARVKTQEGREVLCASCGKNLEEGPSTEWV